MLLSMQRGTAPPFDTDGYCGEEKGLTMLSATGNSDLSIVVVTPNLDLSTVMYFLDIIKSTSQDTRSGLSSDLMAGSPFDSAQGD
jgi:hypothetical protein